MRDKEMQIKKNRLDLEYRALMQERNALIILITGAPVTILNLGIVVLKGDLLIIMIAAWVSVILSYSLKLRHDEKLNTKLDELNALIKSQV